MSTMNKATPQRLSAAFADLQRADEALAETQRILKKLAQDQKRHPLPGRRKVSIVDEIKAILGIK